MSQIRVNNITNRTGITGPTVAGIASVSSNSHFVVPTGRTGQRYADDGENIVRDGLVLYLDAKYSYPNASGTNPDVYTWYDMSGNENHGELINGVGYNSANGGSLVFDGTNDFCLSNNPISTLPTSPFTFEVIAKRNKNTDWQTIISMTGSYTQLAFGSDDRIKFGRNGGAGGINADSNYPTTIGTWYHIVGTYDGNQTGSVVNVNVYVNGEIKLLNGNMGVNGNNNGTFIRLGAYGLYNGGEYLLGNIAIARIYNRALSATEVLQNFNATKSRFGL